MALSPEQVRSVAALARLDLNDDEIIEQSAHLNRLLAHVEMLQQADINGLEPTSHPMALQNVLRDDRVSPSLNRDECLANAPEARDGCFVVPRIMEAE